MDSISKLFAFSAPAQAAADRMTTDEDILTESRDFGAASSSPNNAKSEARAQRIMAQHVPLNWKPGMGGHKANSHTKRLFDEAGGLPAITKFTNLFYQKAFADPHIDQFIRDHNDPHGERFAAWIAEKFGGGPHWSNERRNRKVCPFHSHGHQLNTPHDRSSAHFAAWHSPKRAPENFGEHFKLDDCRVWMRLHFWAMREAGIYEVSPAFADYYIRFLGHFVSVYERSATSFARESARWSANPKNIKDYLANGRRMEGVVGLSLREALNQLPAEEQPGQWPYEY